VLLHHLPPINNKTDNPILMQIAEATEVRLELGRRLHRRLDRPIGPHSYNADGVLKTCFPSRTGRDCPPPEALLACFLSPARHISATLNRPASDGLPGRFFSLKRMRVKRRRKAFGARKTNGLKAQESKMPKLKTKSGAKKRFKITGTGKVVYAQKGKRHGMIKRTNKQIRNLRGTSVLFKTDGDNIKKYFLPNG
jgi:large subunit ribosomal protein L35